MRDTLNSMELLWRTRLVGSTIRMRAFRTAKTPCRDRAESPRAFKVDCLRFSVVVRIPIRSIRLPSQASKAHSAVSRARCAASSTSAAVAELPFRPSRSACSSSRRAVRSFASRSSDATFSTTSIPSSSIRRGRSISSATTQRTRTHAHAMNANPLWTLKKKASQTRGKMLSVFTQSRPSRQGKAYYDDVTDRAVTGLVVRVRTRSGNTCRQRRSTQTRKQRDSEAKRHGEVRKRREKRGGERSDAFIPYDNHGAQN